MKTLLILLFPICGFAQIKIGDITVSEAIAKEYFLDLYKRPDTIFVNFNSKEYEYYKKHNLGTVSEPVPPLLQAQWDREDEIERVKRRKRDSIAAKNDKQKRPHGKIYYAADSTIHYFSNYNDTNVTDTLNIFRFYGGHSRMVTTEGFIVPREIRKEDFTEWFLKHH